MYLMHVLCLYCKAIPICRINSTSIQLLIHTYSTYNYTYEVKLFRLIDLGFRLHNYVRSPIHIVCTYVRIHKDGHIYTYIYYMYVSAQAFWKVISMNYILSQVF